MTIALISRESGITKSPIKRIMREFEYYDIIDVDLEKREKIHDDRKYSGERLKDDLKTFVMLSKVYSQPTHGKDLKGYIGSAYAQEVLSDDHKLPFLIYWNYVSGISELYAKSEIKKKAKELSEGITKGRMAQDLADFVNEFIKEEAASGKISKDFAREYEANGRLSDTKLKEAMSELGSDGFLQFVSKLVETLNEVPLDADEDEEGDEEGVRIPNLEASGRGKYIMNFTSIMERIFSSTIGWRDAKWIIGHSPAVFRSMCLSPISASARNTFKISLPSKTIRGNRQRITPTTIPEFARRVSKMVDDIGRTVLPSFSIALAYDMANDNLILSKQEPERSKELKLITDVISKFNA